MFVIDSVIRLSRGTPRATLKENALASALGSAAGGMLGSLWQRGTNHIQWRRSQQMQEDEQEFNAEQAEIARQWEEKMQKENNAWEEGMYLKYNSPEALRRQYEAAGINPYMAMGDTATPSAVGASSPAHVPSAPVAQSSIGSVGLGGNTSIDFAKSFSDIASGLEKLSQSGLNEVNQTIMEQAASDIVKRYQLDAEGQEFLNDVNKDLASFVKANPGRLASAQYNRIMAEIGNLDASAKAATSQSDLLDIQKRIQDVLMPVYRRDAHIADLIDKRAFEYVNNIFRHQEMEITTGYSNAASNRINASANWRHSAAHMMEAQTGSEVGKSIIDLNTSNTRLNNIAAHIREATSKEEIRYLKEHFVNEAIRGGLFNKKESEELIRLRNKNKTYWFDYGFDKALKSSNEIRQWYNSLKEGRSNDANFYDGWNMSDSW